MLEWVVIEIMVVKTTVEDVLVEDAPAVDTLVEAVYELL